MEPKIIKKDIQDDKSFNNQKKVLVLSILCMVVLLISSSYAIMTNFSQKEDAITFSTGNLEMTILNGEEIFSLINLNNKLPESDESGLSKATVIPITLKNTGTMIIGTYEIKLVSNANTISTLSDEHIRFSVSEDNITYSSPSTLTDNDNIIFTGKDLDVDQTKTIYLKIWGAETAGELLLDNTFYGSLNIKLRQQEKNIIPTILNVSDAGYGKITFTAVENTNPISAYCVNKNQKDTSNCTWYKATVGEQTTRQIVSKSGTYYLHLKDTKNYTTHSDSIVMTVPENIAIDLSGNDNNGTITGATLTSDGLSFDGTNDYIIVNNMEFNSTKTLTIDFIAKIEETDLGMIAESSTNLNSNANTFYFDVNEFATNSLATCIRQTGYNIRYTGSIVDSTKFQHFTVMFDTTNSNKVFFQTYLNKTLETTTLNSQYSADITNVTLSNYPLYIGSRGGNSLFTKMIIKEFRIYSKVLTNTEIENNYNGNIVENGLLINYKFN